MVIGTVQASGNGDRLQIFTLPWTLRSGTQVLKYCTRPSHLGLVDIP